MFDDGVGVVVVCFFAFDVCDACVVGCVLRLMCLMRLLVLLLFVVCV